MFCWAGIPVGSRAALTGRRHPPYSPSSSSPEATPPSRSPLPTISPKTVDRHRAKILDKLELRDRVDLTCYAVRVGRPRRTAGRVCC